MFRVNPEHPFKGPHQRGEMYTLGDEPAEARAAVILLHGRGARADSILRLASELTIPGVHYSAPQATDNSWYPWSFLKPVDMNQPGLSSALQVVADQLSMLSDSGIPSERVILGGFSQGACLASEFVARHPKKYGGVVALSGGLIGETLPVKEYQGDLESTPYFVGCSDVDAHIPLERVEQTAAILESLGADVDKRIYPGMGHTINREEMEILELMIRKVAG